MKAQQEPNHTGDAYEHCAPLFAELAELSSDTERHEALRHQLVEEYLPVAEHIARRFAGRGESHEDLLQVARLGLVNAVDRFEYGRGNDFLSFAVPTIMGEVRRYFRDIAWSVRVPRRLKELHQAINKATSTLAQSTGRAPTPSELAAYLEIDVNEVTDGLLAGNAYHTTSVDKPVTTGTEPVSLADTIGDDDAALANVEDHELLRPLLARLSGRERAIIKLRFFDNLPQTQIAERIGISQMHVSRLLSQILKQLRAELTDGEGE